MEIVTGEPAPQLERADAARLLEEMAAVVRTIFGVESTTSTASAPEPAPAVAAPATAPAPAPVASPAPMPGGVPASIPVPGAAILQEIAFLDD